MKQILFATSALVAFAGAASAEVAVTGDARIGLRYDNSLICTDCADGERSGFNVVSRARIKFIATGETDSGLSFGAELRADQAGGANQGSNSSMAAGTVFISGTYGRLTAGDVDSALESAVGDLPEIGVSGLNYYNEFQYTSSDYDSEEYGESVLLYEYKFGDASVYASFQDSYVGNTGDKRGGNNYAVGAGYTLGNYSFGLGYEKANLFVDPVGYTWTDETFSSGDFTNAYDNDNTTFGISGGTSVIGITFKAIYLSTSVDGSDAVGSWSTSDYDVRQYGIGAEYKLANGIQLAGFWRKIDGDDRGGVENKVNIYGLGAGYDLGGGAVVKAGIARIDGNSSNAGLPGIDGVDGDFDRTVGDFGLQLKF